MVEETGTSNIKVMCRFRPVSEKEKQVFPDLMCVEFLNDNQTFIVNPQSEHNDPLQFKFDYVFPPESPQEKVYDISAKPIVEAVLQGFNGTVFAYGQTSSGKTFTMMGTDDENMGIIPRMVSTVFGKILKSHAKIEFQVKLAYCEIYMEKIRDLLEPSKVNLKIHEEKTRGIYIADLTEQYVTCESEVFELMSIGNKNREVGSTNMNAGSSRSHSLFSLTITQTNLLDYSAKTGKLYLVDLAGSEKVSKTGAAGKRLEEAKNINKSLTMLGLVIAALTDPKSGHIPYRDSKLTRILQDSLGGNSKTVLIVTCSPSPYNESETVSTCRFGIRAKSIKNKPKVNREYTLAELKLMLSKAREEISRKNRIIIALEKALGRSASTLPNIKDQLEDEEEKEESELNETKMAGAYDEVITELEEARNKIEEEMQNSAKLKMGIENLMLENKDLLNGHDFINKQIMKLQEKLTLTEELLRNKEDCAERLTVANEELKNELSGENSKKLNLEIIFLRNELENSKRALQSSNQVIEEENKQILEELKEEKNKTSRLLSDMETMEVNMQKLISKNTNLFDEEALRIIEDSHAALKGQWQDEKRTLLREINLRIDSNLNLKEKLKESDEKFLNLERNLSDGERVNKDRSDTLERNLEQLTLMYYQLVNRESQLKVDKKISDAKTTRLANKLLSLEKEVKTSKEEIDKLRYANELANAELIELREFKNMQMQDFLSPNMVPQRRTIRGGVPDLNEPNRRTLSFYPPVFLDD